MLYIIKDGNDNNNNYYNNYYSNNDNNNNNNDNNNDNKIIMCVLYSCIYYSSVGEATDQRAGSSARGQPDGLS